MDVTRTLISFEDFVPTGLRDDYLQGKCREIELVCLDGSQFSDKYDFLLIFLVTRRFYELSVPQIP